MTLKPPHETFVRTTADLTQLWIDLMGSDGFSFRSLWMIFLYRDGGMAPVVSPVEDIPRQPDAEMLHNVARVIRELSEDRDVSAAFLLSRPGPDQVLQSDRAWAAGLIRTLGRQLSPWPIHLATTGRVRVIGADDLIGA